MKLPQMEMMYKIYNSSKRQRPAQLLTNTTVNMNNKVYKNNIMQ